MTWSHKANHQTKMQPNTEPLLMKRKSSVTFSIADQPVSQLGHSSSSSPPGATGKRRKMQRRFSKVGPMFFKDMEQAKSELFQEYGPYILNHDSPRSMYRFDDRIAAGSASKEISVVMGRLRQLGLCDSSHSADLSSRLPAKELQTDLSWKANHSDFEI